MSASASLSDEHTIAAGVHERPGTSMFGACSALLRRELKLSIRSPGEWLNPLLFNVLVVSLIPLGVGPDPDRLADLAPGVLWVAALLAVLLSLERLFRGDYDDGALELLVLGAQPLAPLIATKCLAHWLLTGLPLLLVAVALGHALYLPAAANGTLALSLALGTPVLSLIGAIVAALTLSLRRGGALTALIALPLFVPVLVFGSGAVSAAAQGLPATGQLYALGALLALSVTLAPLAAAAALGLALE